jgi:hypothetical protein
VQQLKQAPQFDALKNILSHPLLSGAVTIIGFITAIRSNDMWVRTTAAILTLALGGYFLYIIRPWLRCGVSWITWKFFLGLLSGTIIGAVATPLIFEPALSTFMTLVSPRIAFLDSTPENGEMIYKPSSSVLIRFSEPIPWPFYDFIKVKISPIVPIEISWISNQELAIQPKKIYPERESGGIINPRFEFNSAYDVTVSGPGLKQPIKIYFHTPKQ